MKNISLKTTNFQKIYASRIVDAIFFIAAVEIYFLVLVIYGGAR